MARVTQEEIKEMNELYLQYKTYSAVAREIGRAPSTVKKYIDPNYQHKEEVIELKPIDWEKLFNAPAIDVFGREWDDESFLS